MSLHVKIPKSKEPQQQSNASPKIYVGRLTEGITEKDLRDYYSSFGEVTHVFIPNRPFRGFAFVKFLHADVAQSLFGEDHVVKNTSVIVADANPKSESQKDSTRQDDYDDNESFSQGQNAFGSNRGLRGGVRVIDLAQFGFGSGSGSGGVAFGNGQGRIDAAPGNSNLSPQLSQALVSAVLNQLTGVMQSQGQGQKQQKQQGGGRSSSTQNYRKKSSQTGKRGYQGRLRGN